MAITIVSESEKLKLEKSGSTFFYRRCPAHIRAGAIQKHTPRRGGEPNWEKVSLELLEWAVLGWENVKDDGGNPVEFNKELVGYLPGEIAADLIDATNAGKVEKLEAELKN